MIYADMNWADKTIRPLLWAVPAAGAWVVLLSGVGLPMLLTAVVGLAAAAFAVRKVHQDPRNYRVVMGVALWAWAAFALGMAVNMVLFTPLPGVGAAVALLTLGAPSVLTRHRRANAGADQGWGTQSTASQNIARAEASDAPRTASMAQHVRHARDELSRAHMANVRHENERGLRMQAQFDNMKLEDEASRLRQTVATQDARIRELQNELDKRDDPFYDPPAPQQRA